MVLNKEWEWRTVPGPLHCPPPKNEKKMLHLPSLHTPSSSGAGFSSSRVGDLHPQAAAMADAVMAATEGSSVLLAAMTQLRLRSGINTGYHTPKT